MCYTDQSALYYNRLANGATGIDSDTESDDVVAMVFAPPCGGPATLHIYRENSSIGMLQKMSVKLPMPT
eukprot:2004046-Amphidinium_carterae.1